MDHPIPRSSSHPGREHAYLRGQRLGIRTRSLIRSAAPGLQLRRAWLVLCLLLGPGLSDANPAAHHEPLSFAPLPLENASLTLARNQRLSALLGQLLQREVQTVLYPSHSELLEALTNGEVDLAELGPLPALLASEDLPDLAPIATFREDSDQPHYRCVIAAAVDGIPSLQELQARVEEPHNPSAAGTPLKLMLTGPESTCGPTMTLWSLQEAGISLNGMQAHYRGTHDAVALAVLRNPESIGGLKESVALRFHALGLRILGTSPPVPGFALFAHPAALTGREREKLSRALLELPADALRALDNGHNGFAAHEKERQSRLAQQRTLSESLLGQLSFPERQGKPGR